MDLGRPCGNLRDAGEPGDWTKAVIFEKYEGNERKKYYKISKVITLLSLVGKVV